MIKVLMSKAKVWSKIAFIFVKTGNLKKALFFGVLKGGSNIDLVREFSLKKKTLNHTPSGRSIHAANLFIFDNDVSLLKEAFEKFSLDEIHEKVYMSVVKHGKKLKLQMNSFDGWGAFYEILVKDAYETILDSDFVVVDVGMNVGTAALAFASNDRVKRVYGFEPVPSSCTMAARNFDLNGAIGDKINITCAALGKGNKIIQIPAASGGSVGVSVTGFVMEKIHEPSDYKSTIDVVVKDASTAISEILQQHNEKILLKLDCEGAEYEIIKDLFEQNILDKIAFIIIEWHYNGKSVLVDKLIKSGFILFAPDLAFTFPVGLIYGINSSKLVQAKQG